MNNRLAAVVVTFNRLAHLQTCVAALLEQDCDAILVVDNGSTDGTREWLSEQAERHERLDLLPMPRNLGGAGGFEVGFWHAQARYRPEWIVCFDDDAHPQPGAFRAFLDSDLDGVDAAAAAGYYPDGRICEMNRPNRNPFWHWRLFLRTLLGGRDGFHIDDQDYQAGHAIPVDATSFVGFFVRGEMLQEVGLPAGELFIYGDDVLYSLNISRAGRRIRFLPWVRFTHDCSTFDDDEPVYRPLWKAYYTYRNGLRVYHAAAGWLFWGIAPLKILQWTLKARFYQAPGTYLRVLGMALGDAIRRRYDRPHDSVVRLCEDGERSLDAA